MVKGVNKTVIEINDTGSNIFEKVILFVTPKYSNLSSKRLKIEAKRVVNGYSISKVPTMRQRYRRRRILFCAASALLLAGIAAMLILIF